MLRIPFIHFTEIHSSLISAHHAWIVSTVDVVLVLVYYVKHTWTISTITLCKKVLSVILTLCLKVVISHKQQYLWSVLQAWRKTWTVPKFSVLLTVHVYPDGGGDGLGVVVVGAPALQHAAHVSPGQVLQLQHHLHYHHHNSVYLFNFILVVLRKLCAKN